MSVVLCLQECEANAVMTDMVISSFGILLQVECVQALLEAGADRSAGAMDDMSALHFAAQQGNTEVVKELINAGV